MANLDIIDNVIVSTMQLVSRNLATDRVMPWQIVPWVPDEFVNARGLSERNIRRRMTKLQDKGYLERVGDPKKGRMGFRFGPQLQMAC